MRLYFVFVLVLAPLVLVLDDILLATRLAYGGENSSLPTLAIIISVVISRPWSRDSSSFCPGLGLETGWPSHAVTAE